VVLAMMVRMGGGILRGGCGLRLRGGGVMLMVMMRRSGGILRGGCGEAGREQ